MFNKFFSVKAMVLGTGLTALAPLAAQTTTSQTTANNSATQDSSSLVLRDGKGLIGATLSTTGGRYGTISDLIYDGAGIVEYALVERQGQIHPVPFSLLQFGATGDATVSASSATLDTVTVDRNNLRSIFDNSFAAQLRAAFGPNVIRPSTNSNLTSSGTSTSGNSTTTTSNANSTAAARNQVFSLSGLLGGAINAQNGEAGTISTVAINPNGTFAYAVGVNSTGDLRFAVPFAVSQLNAQANGLSVASPISTLTSIAVPQGSLPTMADQAFLAALTTAFGNQANSFVIGGTNPGLSTAQMNLLARNDTFNNDPVVRAGNSSQAGADAVAGAGDSRRGGADAVARAGDRASTAGTGTAGAAMQNGGGNGAPGSNIASSIPRSAPQSTNPSGNRTLPTTASTTATISPNAGGIVNLSQDVASTQSTTGSNSGLIQMRDLLNYKIQAQDGAFGRVSDIVFDRNGNIQYLLGSYQGQTYPLPFSPSAFSGSSNNTLSYNVPIASLQQLAINPQQLPTLQNQAFTQRMQQVFGASFAANSTMTTSSYPTNPTTTTGTNTGTGTTGTSGSTNQTTTGTNTGSSTIDTWSWPGSTTGSQTAPVLLRGPRANKEPAPPGVKSFGPAGTGTGTGSGLNKGSTVPAPNPRRPTPNIVTPPPGVKSFAPGTGGNTQNSPANGNPNGQSGSGTTGAGSSSGTSGGSTGGSSGGSTGGSGS